MPSATGTYYEVASSRLDEQLGSIDALDGKASTAFGFSAALLPIFGVFFAGTDHPEGATVLYALALAVYVGLVLAALMAYRVAGWSYRPDLDTLRANSERYAEYEVRLWAADECRRSINHNTPLLDRKAGWVKMALVLLAVDAVLLSAAALATLA
jgi:hypothetical protein